MTYHAVPNEEDFGDLVDPYDSHNALRKAAINFGVIILGA